MSTGKQVVSRNFAVLSIGQVASRLLAFATTLHVAQRLLPENFGAMVFATSVLLYAGLLVDFGFDAYGPIATSRGLIPLRKLASTVMSYRLLLVLPAYIALAIFAFVAPVPPLTRAMLLLYGLSLLSNALDLSWVFLGTKTMWPSVLAEGISQTLILSLAYTFIKEPAQALLMPLIFLGARLCAVTFLIAVFTRSFGSIKLSLDVPLLKELLKGALPLSGSTVMAMVSNNFDVVVVGLWLGVTGAGLYGAASRVVLMPTMISIAYYTALRPLLAQAYINGFETVEPLFRRSVRVTAALAIGIGTGGVVLAEEIMRTLYGPGYSSAVASFQILLLSFSFLLISRNYRLLLITFNNQTTDLKVMTAAAMINIGLNLALIHPLGITGAAIATLTSEFFILVVDYICTRKLIAHVPVGRYFIKPIMAATVMTVALVLTDAWNVYAQIIIGGLIYAVAIVAMGVVSLQEIRSAIDTLFSRDQSSKPAPESASAGGSVKQLTPVGRAKE
jgi:O-antigen/teichoic acid export membrane protein